MSDLMTERYGGASPARRRAVIAVSGLVGVVALVWLLWAAFVQSTPKVQSGLVGWEVVDTGTVRATVEVRTTSPDVDARCLLRASAADRAVVGETSFEVTGVRERETRQVDVRTEREASSVVLVGCTADGQDRPR